MLKIAEILEILHKIAYIILKSLCSKSRNRKKLPGKIYKSGFFKDFRGQINCIMFPPIFG